MVNSWNVPRKKHKIYGCPGFRGFRQDPGLAFIPALNFGKGNPYKMGVQICRTKRGRRNMAEASCANCKLRAKYDHNPKSLIGRFWRWHIGWCPGFRSYLLSLPEADRRKLAGKYGILDKVFLWEQKKGKLNG
jgi:hypothetical protein